MEINLHDGLFEITRDDVEELMTKYINILVVSDVCHLNFISIYNALISINKSLFAGKKNLHILEEDLRSSVQDHRIEQAVINHFREAIGQLENLKVKFESNIYLYKHENSLKNVSFTQKSNFGISLTELQKEERLNIEKDKLILEDPIILNYITNHPIIKAFLDLKAPLIRTKYNLICAGLFLQLIEKDWISDTIASRKRVRFLNEKFLLDIKDHNPFAMNSENYKNDYSEYWEYFTSMPRSPTRLTRKKCK